ncbi:hypothetical protein HDV05_002107 [Chytridiales sp. JEL 0842]|nr:hypothetical protein HDV05_002107 [Chytridiales sp. JEL 0842]
MNSVDEFRTALRSALDLRPSSDPRKLLDAVKSLIPGDDTVREEISSNTDLLSFLADVLKYAVDELEADKASRVEIDDYKTLAACVCMLVAESAKSESARGPFQEAGMLKFVGEALKCSTAYQDELSQKLTIQCLRALANMCYENETNRDAVLEVGGALRAIVKCFSSDSITMLQTVCGSLVNITMDNEPVQTEVLEAGCLSKLLDILELAVKHKDTHGHMISTSLRVINNLCEIEKGVQCLMDAQEGLPLLIDILREQHAVILGEEVDEEELVDALEMLESLTAVLETIGENDAVQRAIVSLDLLNTLLDFVDHRPKVPLPKPDEENEVPDYELIRKNISRIVTLVTMNDANMSDIPLHTDVIDRFKQWMTQGLGTSSVIDEDEIRMSGALCIGNLARSDDTCALLTKKHQVGPALLELLNLEMDRVKTSGVREETKSCIKVLHAVVGAFKNLSLAKPDRAILGDLGIIGPIASLLEIEGVKPVHLQCVGVLKNLCSVENEVNVYRVLTGLDPKNETKIARLPVPESATVISSKKPLTPFQKLIRHIWRATGDNLAGIRNEGGRVIVNLVRTSHLCGAPHLIKTIVDANGITPLIQIVTGALLTKQKPSLESGEEPNNENLPIPHESSESLDTDHHVHFDAVPLEGQVYPLVQNEGLVALVLIANAVPGAISMITRYHTSLIPTAKSVLGSGMKDEEEGGEGKVVYADPVKINVCLLMGTLADADGKGEPYVKDGFAAVLKVDISGWTKLTSELLLGLVQTSLGKVASELVTNTLSSYMNQIVTAITQAGGDIFNGDTCTVSFPVGEDETEGAAVDRAMRCGLRLLQAHSGCASELGCGLEDIKRLQQGINLANKLMQVHVQKSSDALTTTISFGEDDTNAVNLTIHVGVTAGEICHLIIGSLEDRLEYCLYGNCLEELVDILDAAGGGQWYPISGEFGISTSAMELLQENLLQSAIKFEGTRLCDRYVVLSGESLATLQSTSNSEFNTLSDRRMIRRGTTIASINVNLPAYATKTLSLFMNQPLLKILQEPSYCVDNPISLSGGEFRTVSVIYVNLTAEFDAARVQKIMIQFIDILKKWNGFFQQYHMNGKGEVMVASFGLLQGNTEKDAKNAVSAAIELSEFVARDESGGLISIAVTTGDMLITRFGNPARGDISLLGGVVIMASRLLLIDCTESCVKCDKATYFATKDEFHHMELGMYKFKGKKNDIPVWAVRTKTIGPQSSSIALMPDRPMFGYQKERTALTNALDYWRSVHGKAQNVVIIEGKVGIGKTKMAEFLYHQLESRKVSFCTGQGSESTQFFSYSSLQTLLNFIMTKPLDDQQTTFCVMGSNSSIQKSQPDLSSGKCLEGNLYQSATLKDRLAKLGQGPEAIPLLATVLPNIDIASGSLKPNIDAAIWAAQLKSVLVNMVIAALRYERFAFVFDDTQWMDPMTLDVISLLVKKCPDLFLVLLTRPLIENKQDTLHKVLDQPNALHMTLHGINILDTEQILRAKMSKYVLKNIAPVVINVIHEKTNGVPLALELMLETVKTRFDEVFQTDSNGTLNFVNDGAAFVSSISKPIAAINLLFDRLPENHKEILQKASIIGQIFSLLELCPLLNFSTTPDELHSLIKAGCGVEAFIRGTVDQYPFSYSFRQHLIMSAVNETLSVHDRCAFHETAAEIYEATLDESNKHFVLPTVAYHYQRSAAVEKKVHYLEEVALRHCRHGHWCEAVYTFLALLEVVKSKPSVVTDMQRRAYWVTELAIAFLESRNYNVKEICVEALKWVGKPWPSSDALVKTALRKEFVRFLWLWMKTKGGTRPLKTYKWIWPFSLVLGASGSRLNTVAPERQSKSTCLLSEELSKEDMVRRTTLTAYRALFRAGSFSTSISKEEMGYITFTLCNLAITSGHAAPATWIKVAYLAAYGLATKIPPLSQMIFDRAIEIEKTLGNDKTSHKVHLLSGLLYFQRGMIEEAQKSFENSKNFFKLRGDLSQTLLGEYYLSTVSFFQGKPLYIERELLELAQESDSPYRGILWFGLTRMGLYTYNLSEVENRFVHMRDTVKTLPACDFNRGAEAFIEALLIFHRLRDVVISAAQGPPVIQIAAAPSPTVTMCPGASFVPTVSGPTECEGPSITSTTTVISNSNRTLSLTEPKSPEKSRRPSKISIITPPSPNGSTGKLNGMSNSLNTLASHSNLATSPTLAKRRTVRFKPPLETEISQGFDHMLKNLEIMAKNLRELEEFHFMIAESLLQVPVLLWNMLIFPVPTHRYVPADTTPPPPPLATTPRKLECVAENALPEGSPIKAEARDESAASPQSPTLPRKPSLHRKTSVQRKSQLPPLPPPVNNPSAPPSPPPTPPPTLKLYLPSPEKLERLIDILNSLIEPTQFFAEKAKMPLFFWPLQMLQCAHVFATHLCRSLTGFNGATSLASTAISSRTFMWKPAQAALKVLEKAHIQATQTTSKDGQKPLVRSFESLPVLKTSIQVVWHFLIQLEDPESPFDINKEKYVQAKKVWEKAGFKVLTDYVEDCEKAMMEKSAI